MSAAPPTVSVVVPVHDGERHLGEALASVPRDPAWPVEVIVVDDGSTDGTRAVVRASGIACVLHRQARAGPAAARNAGLARARAPVIGFLDADDRWPPDKLAVQMGYLAAHPEADGVLGRVQWLGRVPGSDAFAPVGAPIAGAQLGCGLFRRRLFARVGLFDATLADSEDVDWLLRARERGARLPLVPEVGLLYRHHEASMTFGRPTASLSLLHVLKRALDRRRQAGRPTRPGSDGP